MFHAILYLHIAAGTGALIAGTVAMIAAKGFRIHRLSGKVFLVSMITTAISAIGLSIMHSSNFLLAIGLFALYLVISGWNWAQNAPPHFRKRITQTIGLLGIGFATFMLFRALIQEGTQGSILGIFGGIMLVLAISDFTIPKTKVSYVPRHAGRMGGAYIAAATAFLVVNVDFLPALVVWLGPTVMGSILISVLITKWIRRYG